MFWGVASAADREQGIENREQTVDSREQGRKEPAEGEQGEERMMDEVVRGSKPSNQSRPRRAPISMF